MYVLLIRLTAVLLSILCLAYSPHASAQNGSLSVLTLNVGGIGKQAGVAWPTRAERIAAWAQQSGAVPDVIAL
jgi:hypothetical protein